MKDIPVFTTENGAASLILREIPARKAAYVRIQSSRTPEALALECACFCRMCGAETVYAAGDPALEAYPFHTAVLRLARPVEGLPDTDAALFPVQEETLERWREIYNEAMASVPNASWMTLSDAREMLREGDGYFVHRGEELLGIGRASGETIWTLAAVKRGAGADVVLALTHALTGDRVVLEAASENRRAMALYERLGFLKIQELSRWYRLP